MTLPNCYRCGSQPCECEDGITSYHGDAREILPLLEPGSVDLVCTDPPYGIGFMGKQFDTFKPEYLAPYREADTKREDRTDGRTVAAWSNAADAGRYDRSASANLAFQVWCHEMFTAILPACKPGTMLAAFGGTRTYHRLTCGIEDAGWEVRDCILANGVYASASVPGLAWYFGSGFPKSHNFGCKCGGGTVQYSHEEKAVGEGGVCDLQEDVSQASVLGQEDKAALLQPPVQRDSTRQAVGKTRLQGAGGLDSEELQELSEEDEGSKQSRMEGRSDVLAEARQLQTDQVCEVSSDVSGDGTQGRLRDGTSSTDSSISGAASKPPRSGSSQEPRSAGQSAGESRTVPVEQPAQEGRGAACPKCGGLIEFTGYGTALKPAWEPIVLAMKPLDGTFAQNAIEHGVAGINVDGGRVGTDDVSSSAIRKPGCQKYGGQNYRPHHDGDASPTVHGSTSGRFPANLILSHHESCRHVGAKRVKSSARPNCVGKAYEVDGVTDFPASPKSHPIEPDADGLEEVEEWECATDENGNCICPVGMLDEQSGERPSCNHPSAAKPESKYRPGQGNYQPQGKIYPGDTGTASRFFKTFAPCRFAYVPKASGKDRGNLPAEELPLFGMGEPEFRNIHPTVKPLELMRYLLTLLYPPSLDAVCLDPFAGSGTTGRACKDLGRKCIMVEIEEKYCDIAARRLGRE